MSVIATKGDEVFLSMARWICRVGNQGVSKFYTTTRRAADWDRYRRKNAKQRVESKIRKLLIQEIRREQAEISDEQLDQLVGRVIHLFQSALRGEIAVEEIQKLKDSLPPASPFAEVIIDYAVQEGLSAEKSAMLQSIFEDNLRIRAGIDLGGPPLTS